MMIVLTGISITGITGTIVSIANSSLAVIPIIVAADSYRIDDRTISSLNCYRCCTALCLSIYADSLLLLEGLGVIEEGRSEEQQGRGWMRSITSLVV